MQLFIGDGNHLPSAVNYGQSIAFQTKPGLHQNSWKNSIQIIRCFAANILKAHALMRRSCSEQLYLVFNAIRIQQFLIQPDLPDQPAIFEPIAGPSRVYPLREHNPNIIAPTNDS
ncbi:unnamed protein product [Parnassius apollo]|uniref:(apollo) hypothetical protein n=1 Tax=Parnassius apollo TaxID=110799 RepID=A0A8S3XNV2_PARAO|nr:unnamed protein product [Parnassius apollo]